MEFAPLVGPLIAAVASIAAATIAVRSARRSQVAEAEAVRLRQLEERLSSKKVEMYEPLLQHLGNLLAQKPNAEQDSERVITDFMNLVVVYGSDDVLQAFARFRTGSATSPSPKIIVRLAADLFAAIRRDLAGSTAATGLELIGMRITDIYEGDGELLGALVDPFPLVCEREGWTPPWQRSVTQSRSGGRG